MSTIMNGDGNYACVLLRIFYSKELIECNTEKGHKKSYWITDRFNSKIFNKKKFVCVPFYPKGGICGAFYSDKIHS